MTTLNDDPNQLDLNLPGLGPDTVFAGGGSDFVRTSTLGGSVIFGQGDNDTLISVGPNDSLYGGRDEDSLRSQLSPAFLSGEAGADTLIADATATLLGGDGDDYLQGNSSGNLEFGNQGNDTMLGGSVGRDTLYGGKGNDTVGFFISGGSSNIPGFNLSGGASGNEGSNFLRGDLDDDFIAGINNRDSLFGGKGNDTLQSIGNNTYSSGDDGNDTLIVSSFSSPNPFSGQPFFAVSEKVTLLGGAGDDSVVGSIGPLAGGKNTFDGGDGNDTLITYASSDTVTGGGGNDLVQSMTSDFLTSIGVRTSVPGYAGRNILDGGDGNDTIVAAFSTDTMVGGAGNDSLTGLFNQAGGGDGNDTINAQSITGITGRVTLDGGAGNDFLLGNTTANVTNIFRPGEGNDTIVFGTFRDSLIADNAGGDDFIDASKVTGNSTAPLSITDQVGNNFIYGSINSTNVIITGAGGDILIGGGAQDSLFSADGNDLLFGGAGSDCLIGGAGNDSIIGSADIDYMLGGDGADSFYYFSSQEGGGFAAQSATTSDFIGDFDANQDKLIISRSGFGIGAVDPLVIPVTDIQSPNVSVTGSPVIYYERKDGVANVYYDPDGGALDNAVRVVQLTNNPTSITGSIVFI